MVRRDLLSRREFVCTAAGIVGLSTVSCGSSGPASPTPSQPPPGPTVAITAAPDYGAVPDALREGVSLAGGLDIVRGARVAIKANLTGWGQHLLGAPATDSYVVHGSVATALVALLLEHGARSVTVLESALAPDGLDAFAGRLGWDAGAMLRLGDVRFVNTRNGGGLPYADLPVSNGRLFDRFLVHRAYADADVFVSLAKLKNHRAAGVTLGMKNLFGMPPNSLYGADAPSEDASGIRTGIHDRRGSDAPLLPGERQALGDQPPEVRVPNAVADMAAARPIHLTVLDGVRTVAGGEGPWHEATGELQLVSPGILIVGRDPVATDAVATAAMGYADPLTDRLPPFHFCVNHIRLAHDAGLGTGDLRRINVRGLTVAQARTPFAWL